MATDFQFTRVKDFEGYQKLRSSSLAEVLAAPDLKNETWLFVSPHDDDLCVGAGLWLQAAVKAGVNVQVIIITDGRMGYCSLDQRDKIVSIRHAESLESFAILGVPADHVMHAGFPDASLNLYTGRRVAQSDDPQIAGHTGIENALTWQLRATKPARVFVPTRTDLHPDHQITNNELLISLFHASGDIWPELGQPLARVPAVYELAVYCDFAEPPSLEVRSSQDIFDTKLKSIAAYRSQRQIAALVENVRAGGAYEYLRELEFRFYNPANHKPRFA